MNAAGTLADVNEPILFTVGQRPQKDAAHHAEDRGVRADTERQRDDDRERESFDSTKRPQRKSNVGEEVHISCQLPEP